MDSNYNLINKNIMSIVSTNKYTLYKEQVSYDGGRTWAYTGNEYAVLLEADSMECGYIPPYKLKLDMVGGEEITIPYTGGTYVTSGEVNSYKETCKSVTFGKARSIGNSAFKVWQILESVTMYDIRSIGDSAFTNCYLLKDVNLGYNVTSIGENAFYGCSGIKSLTLPTTVTSIGMYAFAGCGISNITIPSGVTTISNYTFMGCDNLTSVTIPSSVTSIGDSVFRSCRRLKSITIPSSVTRIGDWAFSYCSGLTKVVVDDLVAWCNIYFKDSYTNVYSESNPLYYANHLYSNENTEITDLIIPNTITNIKQYAFYRCYGLESVTIPSSVTDISYGSFTDCENLTSITVEATTPPSLYCTSTTSGSTLSPFYNTNNCPIYVPNGSVNAYKTKWSAYSSRIQAIPI